MAGHGESIEMETANDKRSDARQKPHSNHQESVAWQQDGLGGAGLQMDRGWAWCVAFAGAVFTMLGVFTVVGLAHLYVEMQAAFPDYSTATVAGTLSILNGARYLSGFVTPIILEKYSHRKTAIVSGILMGGGLALTFVVDHIAIFYAGFAVAGFGVGAAGLTMFTFLPTYFYKKRSLSVAIASCSVGIGIGLTPIVTDLLLENFGLSGTYLIIGGISLNACVCGSIYQPNKMRVRRRAKLSTDADPILLSVIRFGERGEEKTTTGTGTDRTEETSNHLSMKGNQTPQVSESASNRRQRRNKEEGQHSSQTEGTTTKGSFSKSKEDLSPEPISTVSRGATNSTAPQRKPDILLMGLTFIALGGHVMGQTCVQSFMPAFARENGIADLSRLYLIMGVTDSIAVILTGFLLDLQFFKRIRPVIFCSFLLVFGICVAVMAFITEEKYLSVIVCVQSVVREPISAQLSLFLLEVFGMANLNTVYGKTYGCMGIVSVSWPFFIGWIRDVVGGFILVFLISGAAAAGCGLILLVQILRKTGKGCTGGSGRASEQDNYGV